MPGESVTRYTMKTREFVCYENGIPDRRNRVSGKSLHPKLSLNPGVRRSMLCSRRRRRSVYAESEADGSRSERELSGKDGVEPGRRDCDSIRHHAATPGSQRRVAGN